MESVRDATSGTSATVAGRETKATTGLRRGLAALGAALAVWSLPYLVPGLERFRPWTSEDESPFARLLRPGGQGPMVAESSGGVEFEGTLGERERALLALDGAGQVAWNRPTPGPCGEVAAARLAADEFRDVKVHVEDPRGAMRSFYQALARTACHQNGAVTRISHWGDSAVVRDGLTAVAREHFQKRFGDAGHGFILAATPSPWYVHRGVTYSSAGWKPLRLTHGEARDGRYGYGGTAFLGDSASLALVGTARSGPVGRRMDRVLISFLKGPGQGTLLLRVDGGPTQQVPAAGREWEDALHELKLADGEHRISLKVHGAVKVYGFSLQRSGPGIIYDSLGIVGCLDERLLGLSRAHWRAQLTQHAPHLVILMFGGNTLSFPSFPAEAYARTFDKVLKLFREARPDASCLVVSPLDHGERHGGAIRTRPALRPMIAIQREAAFRNRCAFYSIFDAMGGEGTAARWSRSKPRLLSADLSHASHLGNRILGTLLHRALMSGFQKHLAGSSRKHPPMHSAR